MLSGLGVDDESEASVLDEDEEEARSSDGSATDEEPSMRPVDHVGHPPLSLSDLSGTSC